MADDYYTHEEMVAGLERSRSAVDQSLALALHKLKTLGLKVEIRHTVGGLDWRVYLEVENSEGRYSSQAKYTLVAETVKAAIDALLENILNEITV